MEEVIGSIPLGSTISFTIRDADADPWSGGVDSDRHDIAVTLTGDDDDRETMSRLSRNVGP